jgi:1-deoxy-D-xylulose-5-phosphate reductoisomerase
MRRIALLGATGSIGGSTLDVVARHPDRFRAVALSAHRDVAGLVARCKAAQADYAAIADPALEGQLAQALADAGLRTRALGGPGALDALATLPEVDTVVAAVVGAAGLSSTLAAAAAGKRVLLANKESIVMAGPLLAAALARGRGVLIPVDSEHNAVFQCLPPAYDHDPDRHGVSRIVLTASGGPFRGWDAARLEGVTPDQACAHPKWRMGRKISVDSATLMNKGLEVIEAHHLFGLPRERIDVVIHPQSLVHSLVAYRDGSMLAQLGNPDMRTAIAHALAHPERIDAGVPALDLAACGGLAFEAPDLGTFRCLALAYAALGAGGSAPAILNAANEVAVAAFLAGGIRFSGIATVVADTLDAVAAGPIAALDDALAADAAARRHAERVVGRLQGAVHG